MGPDNLCTYCGQPGHRASHCPRRQEAESLRERIRILDAAGYKASADALRRQLNRKEPRA